MFIIINKGLLKGIQSMAEEVRKLIEKTKEDFGLDSNKIVIAGFSQGGGLALYTGLTHAEKLGGIIALSTWLPLREYVIKRMNEVNNIYTVRLYIHVYFKDNFCPILMGHGTDDQVVPTQWGQKSFELIKEKGVEIEWKKYSGVQHSSCPQEFGDIKSFLDKIF